MIPLDDERRWFRYHYLRAIYRKLGAESREEAVIRAREGGLI